MIKTQFQTQLRVFRIDNGHEYFNKILGNYFAKNGIVHQGTCIDTPQQNSVAERKNSHLLDVAKAISFTTKVPKYLGGEAILTTTFSINR